jgi:methyl-accepting chemotaxis protein
MSEIGEIDRFSQESGGNAQKADDDAAELTRLSQRLQQLIESFRL